MYTILMKWKCDVKYKMALSCVAYWLEPQTEWSRSILHNFLHHSSTVRMLFICTLYGFKECDFKYSVDDKACHAQGFLLELTSKPTTYLIM